jgi:hypothetical protein
MSLNDKAYNSIIPFPEGNSISGNTASDFSTAPLAFLTETLLATQEHWEFMPGLVPLFLREALEALMEAGS